jgi:hypothetical protein
VSDALQRVTDPPMLSAIVGRETTESLDRSNAVAIEVQSASYRTMHGYTIAAALCDDIGPEQDCVFSRSSNRLN